MRLIRLTSTGDGVFENNFNEDIVIQPNSKIGLSSASIGQVNNSITLKGDNRKVEYQFINGEIQTIMLEERLYDNTNFNQIFIDLENKLNSNVAEKFSGDAVNPTVKNKGLGLEWRVTNASSFTNIGYRISGMLKTVESLNATVNNYWVKNSRIGTDSGSDIIFVNDTTGIADYQNFISSKRRISRGLGVWRAHIHQLVKASDYSSPSNIITQGFTFGLTSTKPIDPDANTGLNNGFDFAIRCRTANSVAPHNTAEFNNYKIVTKGNVELETGVAVNFVSVGSADNDFIECVHQGNLITLQRYKTGQTAPDVLASFEDEKFAQMDFYPSLAFHGASVSNPPSNFTDQLKVGLTKVRATISPFDRTSDENTQDNDVSNMTVGVPPPIHNGDTVSENFINFGSVEVAQFFGFDNRRQPSSTSFFLYNGSLLSDTGNIFVSQEKAQLLLAQDSYLVLLDSIQLKSFDGFNREQQRKSILSVIPSVNIGNQEQIIYMKENPIMLEVDNKNPLSLRTIKARITDEEYNPINSKGLAVMVLLVE